MSEQKIAIFPGSFNPITKGHENIVRRAIPLFDKIIVAVGINTKKTYMFDHEQREAWLHKVFEDCPTIEVESYKELTANYCKRKGVRYILRGLRNGTDFDYEKSIAQMNKALYAELESIFLITDPEYSAVHATILREIIANGGDVSDFVPEAVAKEIMNYNNK